MTDLRPVYLSVALRPLRFAYAAGHAPLVDEYDASLVEVKAAVELREAGLADPDWQDEETGQTLPNIEYQCIRGRAAEEALQAHRKAFALMIFHTWEKHVCDYMDWPEYRGEKAFGDLKADGWAIDPKGLKLLQKVANCIKHDSAELFDFDDSLFGDQIILFGTDGVFSKKSKGKRVNREGFWTNWEDALCLSHEHILGFFDIVERSGQIASRGTAEAEEKPPDRQP